MSTDDQRVVIITGGSGASGPAGRYRSACLS
jgi:hypothetical protein